MWDILSAWLADWRHLAILAAAIGLLYLARDAAHRLIRAAFLFIASLLRLLERWMRSGARLAGARRDRLVAGLAEDELQPRIPRETRAAQTYIDRLNVEMPQVRDQLQARLSELQGDYDRGTSYEKRAALRRIARALPATQASVGRLCGIEDRARDQVTKLGEHVVQHRLALQSYRATLDTAQHGGRETKVGHSSGTRFIFALVLIAAVGIAGWLNFALLERPMAEIVGDSYRVMGMPVYRLAALAIIVLEVAVGMVLLEALGGTTMFPQFERLENRTRLRLAIVITMAAALLVLATIEAALALTRDDLTRLERELMATLAGSAPVDAGPSVGDIARYAQAAFGFVIPFALAFLGFALEMLVRNGRVVVQAIVAEALGGLSFVARLLRQITVGAMSLVIALYDFVIFLPLAIERRLAKVRTCTLLTRRAFGLGASALALGACEERRETTAVHALLDVSGSYFRELDKIVRAIRVMMGFIHAGDSFAVAEIGACSYSDESVILKFTAPDRPSERQRMIAAYAQRLTDYGARARKTGFTDIRGALAQAAQYLKTRDAARRAIVIFSDLEEDLPAGCRREQALPAELRGLDVIASNVAKLPEDNRDPARYGRRLETWRRQVEAAGGRWRVMPEPADVVALLRDR